MTGFSGAIRALRSSLISLVVAVNFVPLDLFPSDIALSCANALPPSDFDSDGFSDFVLINANNNVLSWSTLKADGSVQTSLAQFGRLGHQIALGDYLGTNVPQPATVSETKGKIIWRIFSGGTSTAKEFGVTGQYALAGGDYNADGKLDAAVVSAIGKKLQWQIHQSLFTDSATAPVSVTFGSSGDLYFFSNPDGVSDRLTTFSSKGRSGFILRYYNLRASSAARKTVKLQIAKGQLKNRPLPLADAANRDTLLFYQKRAKSTLFTLYLPKKNKLQTFRIKAAGDVLVGNFTSEPGEEVAVQSDSGFIVYNPVNKATTPVAAPAGIAVDEVNINRIGKTPTTGGGGGTDDGDTDPPPTNGEPPPAGLRAVCESYSTISVGQMLIKSEISNHIPGVDPRATGYTFICGSQCTRNLSKSDFYYSNGAYAGSVAMYGTYSKNGKPRLYGAVGQAPQHFADEIAAKARTIGNGKLYMQISAARSGAGTECKEFNGEGRNGGV